MSIERAVDINPLVISTNYDFSVSYTIYDPDGIVDFSVYTYTAWLCEADGTKVLEFSVSETTTDGKTTVILSLTKEQIATLEISKRYYWDLKATYNDEIKFISGTAIVERGYTQ